MARAIGTALRAGLSGFASYFGFRVGGPQTSENRAGQAEEIETTALTKILV